MIAFCFNLRFTHRTNFFGIQVVEVSQPHSHPSLNLILPETLKTTS